MYGTVALIDIKHLSTFLNDCENKLIILICCQHYSVRQAAATEETCLNTKVEFCKEGNLNTMVLSQEEGGSLSTG